MSTEQEKRRLKRPRLENVGKRVDKVIDRAADRVEEETERLIRYLNDEVVPAARQRSSAGLRKAAEKLGKFAEYLDSQRR